MRSSSAFFGPLFNINFLIGHNLPYRYKRSEDARMALEQMEGFELAGRTVRHPFYLFIYYHFISLIYHITSHSYA